MASNISNKFVRKYLNEIRIHEWESGGVTAALVGMKGCGKTHLMLKLANQMVYIHPTKKIPLRETVIWRGRALDYWNWYMKEDFEWEAEEFKRKTFIHYYYLDIPEFTLETGEPLHFPAPCLIPYKSVSHLYDNLQQGEINVIYEPTHYKMSKGMEKLINDRTCSKIADMSQIAIDSPLFWAEFIFFLFTFKKAGFVSIFLDEIDEIFPADIAGVRWHIHALFADTAKDFRKSNISLIYSIHDLTDLDYRIRSKTQYWGYMQGARIPTHSLIPRKQGIFMRKGDIIIEQNGYGKTNLGKLRERLRVKVLFPTGTGDKHLWQVMVGEDENYYPETYMEPVEEYETQIEEEIDSLDDF